MAGSGIGCPPLGTYAKTLYRYYEDHLDPAKQRPARYRRALGSKVVLVTGASRGIGLVVAQTAAEAGAKVLLVARDAAKLEAVVEGIRAAGGEAYAHAADLSSFDEVDALAETVLAQHARRRRPHSQRAARSISPPDRRLNGSLPRLRAHDGAQLLRAGATHAAAPAIANRASGTISHVLTMGVLVPGPYFAAYLATKAALDAFGDSLMSELQHEGIHVSSVYLPLVKTEMMAPVEEYAGRRDVMTAKRAATMIHRRRGRQAAPGHDAGRGVLGVQSNRVTPATTSRILNLIQRTFPVGDAPSEFPMEKAFITNAIGGSPI